jgi:tetratricopeptide (TPR) repeat protein
MYPCLERSLEILNPWLALYDSKKSNRIILLSDDLLNHLLDQLIRIEQNMAAITNDRKQSVAAEGHCQRCLAYSRRFGVEGEQKITFIFAALRAYCQLRQQQSDYLGAVNFAEEGYNLVVTAYDPVHIMTQEAAAVLITALISNGNLYDAERYAQVTYSNLRDKKNGIDQDSKAVAKGTYNLANVIYFQKGDLIKAEILAREVLRIRTRIYDCNHFRIGISCKLLVNILLEKNDLGEETKELEQRCLVIAIRSDGPDGLKSADAHRDIGIFYAKLAGIQTAVSLKQTQLLLSKFHYAEASRIRSKILGPTHPDAVEASNKLAAVTLACLNTR